MSIQEVLQEIKKLADSKEFINYSYIGDVDDMINQQGFTYPGLSIDEISIDNESKIYQVVLYLITDDESLKTKTYNVLKNLIFEIDEKRLQLDAIVKQSTTDYISEGYIGSYSVLGMQLFEKGEVPEEPGYVRSVNGQTGDVILFIPEKVSDLEQDIDYITESDVEDKIDGKLAPIENDIQNIEGQISDINNDISVIQNNLGNIQNDVQTLQTDMQSARADINSNSDNITNLDNKVDNLVTGVSSVNGQTGDVTIEVDLDNYYTKDEANSIFKDKDSFDDFARDVNYDISSLQNKTENIQVDVDNLVSANLDERLTNVEDQTIPNIQNDISNINNDIQLVQADIQVLNNDVSNVNNRVDNLVTGVSSVNGQTGDVTIEVPTGDFYTKTEIDDKVDNINNDISNIYSSVDDIKNNDIYNINNNIYDLQDSVNDIKNNDIYNLDQRVGQNEADISLLRSDVDGIVSAGYTTKEYVDSTFVRENSYVQTISKVNGQLAYVQNKTEQLENDIERIELVKFPNVTIIGDDLSIVQGQISNFSANDYMEFPFLVTLTKPFDIEFEFRTGYDVLNQQNILDSNFGLAFAVRNYAFVLAISTNGTNWNLGELVSMSSQGLVQTNTTYRLRISYDSQKYQIKQSSDGGQTWDILAEKTNVPFQFPYPRQIFIGRSYGQPINYFTGSINLNNSKLLINNELIWQGMDDVGLATRLATDLSNIDEAGIQKIKDIVKEEPEVTINADIHGDLNISGGVVSNFSEDNYLYVQNVQTDLWEFVINLNITTGDDVDSTQVIFSGHKDIHVINVYLENSEIWIQTENGAQPVFFIDIFDFTNYNIKISQAGTNAVEVLINDRSQRLEFDNDPFMFTSINDIYIGYSDYFSDKNVYFRGQIDMTKCYISNDQGDDCWKGTSEGAKGNYADIDLSNISDNGIQKIKDITGSWYVRYVDFDNLDRKVSELENTVGNINDILNTI